MESFIEHEGQLIEYRVVRARRRSIGIRVGPDGEVIVRVPARVSAGAIARVVATRGDWILAAQQRMRLLAPETRYAEGATHHFRGEPLRLDIRTGTPPRVCIEGSSLVVRTADVGDPEAIGRVVEEWYRRQAQEHFAKRLAECWTVFDPGAAQPPSLRVRMMRSRWGSLSPAGVVTLNGHLMRAPDECIDAVIFHELCHLRVRGHGPDFYAELARYVPEWRRLRRQLHDFGS